VFRVPGSKPGHCTARFVLKLSCAAALKEVMSPAIVNENALLATCRCLTTGWACRLCQRKALRCMQPTKSSFFCRRGGRSRVVVADAGAVQCVRAIAARTVARLLLGRFLSFLRSGRLECKLIKARVCRLGGPRRHHHNEDHLLHPSRGRARVHARRRVHIDWDPLT